MFPITVAAINSGKMAAMDSTVNIAARHAFKCMSVVPGRVGDSFGACFKDCIK